MSESPAGTTDSPHDKLFKEAFGNVENAAGQIRCMVPPSLVEHIDFASLTPVPADFRDSALRDSQSDLTYLPPIIPLVVHHRDGGWAGGTRFDDLIDPAVLGIAELARFAPRFESYSTTSRAPRTRTFARAR